MKKTLLSLKLLFLVSIIITPKISFAEKEISDNCGVYAQSPQIKRYLISGPGLAEITEGVGDRLWYTQHIIDDLGAIKSGQFDNQMFSSAKEHAECLSALMDLAYEDSSGYWLDFGKRKGCLTDKKELLVEEEAAKKGCNQKIRARVVKELNYLLRLGGSDEMLSSAATKNSRDNVCSVVSPGAKFEETVDAINTSMNPDMQMARAAGLPKGKSADCLAACTGKDFKCTAEDIKNMTPPTGSGLSKVLQASGSCLYEAGKALVKFLGSLVSFLDPETWSGMAKLVSMAWNDGQTLLKNIMIAAGGSAINQYYKLKCYEQPALTGEYCGMVTNIGLIVAPGKVVSLLGKLSKLMGITKVVRYAAKISGVAELAASAKLAWAARLSKGGRLATIASRTTKIVEGTERVLEKLRLKKTFKLKNYVPGKKPTILSRIANGIRNSKIPTRLNPFKPRTITAAEGVLKVNAITTKTNAVNKVDNLVVDLERVEAEIANGNPNKLSLKEIETIKKSKEAAKNVQQFLATSDGVEFTTAMNQMRRNAGNPTIKEILAKTVKDGTGLVPKEIRRSFKKIAKEAEKTEKALLEGVANHSKGLITDAELASLKAEHLAVSQSRDALEIMVKLQKGKDFKNYAGAYRKLQNVSQGALAVPKWSAAKQIFRAYVLTTLVPKVGTNEKLMPINPAYLPGFGQGEDGNKVIVTDEVAPTSFDCGTLVDGTSSSEKFKQYIALSTHRPATTKIDTAKLTVYYQMAREYCGLTLDQAALDLAENNVYHW